MFLYSVLLQPTCPSSVKVPSPAKHGQYPPPLPSSPWLQSTCASIPFLGLNIFLLNPPKTYFLPSSPTLSPSPWPSHVCGGRRRRAGHACASSFRFTPSSQFIRELELCSPSSLRTHVKIETSQPQRGLACCGCPCHCNSVHL